MKNFHFLKTILEEAKSNNSSPTDTATIIDRLYNTVNTINNIYSDFMLTSLSEYNVFQEKAIHFQSELARIKDIITDNLIYLANKNYYYYFLLIEDIGEYNDLLIFDKDEIRNADTDINKYNKISRSIERYILTLLIEYKIIK